DPGERYGDIYRFISALDGRINDGSGSHAAVLDDEISADASTALMPLDPALAVVPSYPASTGQEIGYGENVALEQLDFPDSPFEQYGSVVGTRVGDERKKRNALWLPLIIACAIVLVASFGGLLYLLQPKQTAHNGSLVKATTGATATTGSTTM